MKTLRKFVVACAALSLVSCTSYRFDAGRIDEMPHSPSRDAAATIQLSDPQLYARETLVNDRRRERSYLEKQLAASEAVRFTPQLQREITQISSLAANLGINFNPTAALQFRDFRQNNAQQQQLDRLQLEFQIAKLQKDLEAYRTSGVGDPKAVPERPAPSTAPAAPTAPSTTTLVMQLQNSIAALTTMLTTPLAGARATDVQPDPREEFADRQAFRLDLRSAGADAQLDDRHDVQGHGLYRLQFRATVTPRENLSKWGLAELTIKRPLGDLTFFERLYSTWLAHATYRLNVGVGEANRDASSTFPDTAYVSLAAGSGLFDVARIWFSNANDKRRTEASGEKAAFTGQLDPCMHVRSERQANVLGCDSIYVAVPPGFRDKVSPPFAAYEDMAFRKLVSEMHEIDVRKAWTADRKAYFALDKTCTRFSSLPAEFANLQPIVDRPTDVDTFVDRIVRAGSFGKWPGTRTQKELLDALLPPKKSADAPKERIAKSGKRTATVRKASPPPDAAPRVPAQSQLMLNSASAQRLVTQLRSFQDIIVNPKSKPAERRKAVDDLNFEEERLLKTAFDIQREWPLERHLLLMPPQDALAYAQGILTIAPVVSSSIRGIGSRRDLPPEIQQRIVTLESIFEEITQSARQYLQLLRSFNPDCASDERAGINLERAPATISDANRRRVGAQAQVRAVTRPDANDPVRRLEPETYEQLGRRPPDRFCSLLLYSAKNKKDPCGEGGSLDGAGYAHATTPTQLSQRISTMSNVADAVQLAVALQAAVPQSGVAAEAAAGYSRQSAAKAQALQRRPLVVGYSGLIDPDGAAKEPNPTTRFGWVFGPPAQISKDGRNLILQQAVTNYQVNADVSVPGWWNEIDLEAKTLWIGNWQDPKLVSYTAGEGAYRPIKVPLPLKRTDLDGLSDLLTVKTLGRALQATRITRVQPSAISACSAETTVVIYGANIWRNARVFVAGVEVPEDNIELLPDMEGLAAKIKTSALQYRSNKMDKPMVVVWTRDGYDQFPVSVTGGLNNDGKCVDKAPSGPPPGESTVAEFAKVSPDKVSACDKTVEFTIVGTNLTSSRDSYYFGTRRATRASKPVIHSEGPGKPALATVKVQFDALHRANAGLESVALAMVKPDGIVSTGIAVGGKECLAPKQESKQQKKDKQKEEPKKQQTASR